MYDADEKKRLGCALHELERITNKYPVKWMDGWECVR